METAKVCKDCPCKCKQPANVNVVSCSKKKKAQQIAPNLTGQGQNK